MGIRAYKTILIFQITLSLLLPIFLSLSRGEDGVDVSISILGNREIERFGRKVFVTGVWNWINVSLDRDVSRLDLILYKGDSPPITRNEENYYAWSYDNGWKAISIYNGNDYIDKDNCKKIENRFCFRVTTENFLENDYENWTLKIDFGESNKTIPIIMENPVRSLAVSGGITVRVEPFQSVTAYGDHYFTTINKGNLPMIINVSYDKLNDRIETSNVNTILLPEESLQHSIEIKTQAWKPGIIRISGTVSGVVPDSVIPNFVVSQPTIQLNVAFLLSPGYLITVIVGHSNCELEELEEGKITFQYRKSIEIYSDEEKNVTSWVCGDGDLNLSINANNLSVLGVWLDGREVNDYSRIRLQLNPLKENRIDVKIKASPGADNGKIIYNLELKNDTRKFETSVTVKEREKTATEKEGNSIVPKLLVIIGIVIALIYILITYMRGKG